MDILNKDDLDQWLFDQIQAGHSCSAVKGPAPAGFLYSDGEQVTQPINVAWRNDQTGEVIEIVYG